MATEIQSRASAPTGEEWELRPNLIYDESKITIINRVDMFYIETGEYLREEHLPTTAAGQVVVWYFDSAYEYPALTTDWYNHMTFSQPTPNGGYGSINYYAKIISLPSNGESNNNQVIFKEGVYSASKFINGTNDTLTHNKGTIYMATLGTDALDKTYLFYDDGQVFRNVVPVMLTREHGGTGADLSGFFENSVIINGKTGLDEVVTAPGALYATEQYGTPSFGTLPVPYGGTGATSFTKYGVLYGNEAGALLATAAGTKGQILAGTDNGAPLFVTPSVTWVAATTTGPKIRLSINGKNYDKVIPSASATASGVVVTADQTFAGVKTFSSGLISEGVSTFTNTVNLTLGSDAYFNSASDKSEGDLYIEGGMTTGLNLRVDGGTIQFAKEAKIKYDTNKNCFNFVFN